jgi:hypothetical protein
MISIKKIMSVIAIAFAVMTISGSYVTASAAITDPCVGNASLPGCDKNKGFGNIFKFGTGDTQTQLQTLISNVAGVLISLIAAVSVIYLILGAYSMISDNGDGKGYKDGLARVKYAILGLVVALLSFFIVSTIIGFVK